MFTQRGFPDSSGGKESTCNAGDLGSIPGSGRSAGEGIGYPLQYGWASLVAQLVRIHPQWGRPRFDLWVEMIPWRRERLPTPAFLPGELHRLHSPWGLKESDVTERPALHFTFTERGKNMVAGSGRVSETEKLTELQLKQTFLGKNGFQDVGNFSGRSSAPG